MLDNIIDLNIVTLQKTNLLCILPFLPSPPSHCHSLSVTFLKLKGREGVEGRGNIKPLLLSVTDSLLLSGLARLCTLYTELCTLCTAHCKLHFAH